MTDETFYTTWIVHASEGTHQSGEHRTGDDGPSLPEALPKNSRIVVDGSAGTWTMEIRDETGNKKTGMSGTGVCMPAAITGKPNGGTMLAGRLNLSETHGHMILGICSPTNSAEDGKKHAMRCFLVGDEIASVLTRLAGTSPDTYHASTVLDLVKILHNTGYWHAYH